ncbi:MAG: hypothetical protein VKI83_03680 [Synechococcaceae cyanobacterium]|nr:hypothetical protein [Synechococcaceae cyanobacterium]
MPWRSRLNRDLLWRSLRLVLPISAANAPVLLLLAALDAASQRRTIPARALDLTWARVQRRNATLEV